MLSYSREPSDELLYWRTTPRTIVVITSGLLLLFINGCAKPSLATSTGPRQTGDWSVSPRQDVQVGETVDFDFVIGNASIGYLQHAEYCLFEIGDTKKVTRSDRYGHFVTQHTFSDFQEGDVVQVTATAWNIRGRQDWTSAGGEACDTRLPGDEPDALAGEATITLVAYVSALVMEISLDADVANFNSAKLTIRPDNENSREIYLDSLQRKGFTVEPVESNVFRVCYFPFPEETSRWGETTAVLSVYDNDATLHHFKTTFLTP